MIEARRFLRYVIPGLAFIIEIVLLLCLSRFEYCRAAFRGLVAEKGLGASLSLFVASGGIGYLFSVVHHTLLWSWYRENTFDHRDMVNRARGCNDLAIRMYGEQGETSQPISQRGAWRIVTSIWKSRIRKSKRIQGADLRADSLTDLAHGSGAGFIGSVAAALIWIFIDFRLSSWQPSWCLDRLWRLWPHALALIVAIVLVRVHWSAFKKTTEFARGYIELVLAGELNEHHRTDGPLNVFVFSRDVKP